MHDLDFNPHQDMQVSVGRIRQRYSCRLLTPSPKAIARAYRYGQKNKVLVMRFMTTPTVEGELTQKRYSTYVRSRADSAMLRLIERMMQIAKKKLVLDHLIVSWLPHLIYLRRHFG